MAAKDNLSGQLRLFTPEDTSSDPIDVSRWARNQQWHASNDEVIPSRDRGEATPASLDEFDHNGDPYNGSGGHPLGIHSGTAWAARERDTPDGQRVYHPMAIHGKDEPPTNTNIWSMGGEHTDRNGNTAGVWSDDAANGADVETTQAVRTGKNVAYRNEGEDVGSISYRSPRSNVRTWSDSVVHNPDATHAERAAVRKGAELVFLPERATRKNQEGWTITSQDGTSTSSGAKKKAPKPVKSPAGLTATPIKINPNPDGFDVDADLESTLTPKFVYPHKKKKGQGKPQGKQLTLDL